MKKSVVLSIVLILLIVLLSGCGNNTDITQAGENESTITSSENTSETIKQNTDEKNQKTGISIGEFDDLLMEQPLSIVKTSYIVQHEEYKSLYPDMLQVIIQNNTTKDIKDAVVAFVAWDKNNLPVKIKGNIDFSDGSYITNVNINDINLIPGEQFGDGSGYEIDENCGIAQFKAIILSFETFEGDTWENPYYDAFVETFAGKKLSNDLTIEAEIKGTEFAPSKPAESLKTSQTSYSSDELDKLLVEQPLSIVKTSYIVQHEEYKSLYPDILQAVIQNNTSKDIKDAVVVFAAWDKNNLPVKIKGSIDFSEGSYIAKVNFNGINLIPGERFGDSSGYEVDESCGITQFKALVLSYETFEGDTWENPYYDAFVEIYAGKRLEN